MDESPPEMGILFLRHRRCGRMAAAVRSVPFEKRFTVQSHATHGWWKRESRCPGCGEKLHFDVEADWKAGRAIGVGISLMPRTRVRLAGLRR